jgi:hypothetical protein
MKDLPWLDNHVFDQQSGLSEKPSIPKCSHGTSLSFLEIVPKLLRGLGGPDRDRTDDLFHAMEARSQLRHRPTLLRGVQALFCPA